MPQISREALEEVRKALVEYEATLFLSPLQLNAKKTYLRHATTFVRWLDDRFEPGAHVDRRRNSN